MQRKKRKGPKPNFYLLLPFPFFCVVSHPLRPLFALVPFPDPSFNGFLFVLLIQSQLLYISIHVAYMKYCTCLHI